MKKKNKKRFKLIKILPIIVSILVLIGIFICIYFVSPVSNDDAIIEFKIDSNSPTITVINNLKKKNLIKNVYFTRLYVKINNITSIKAGDYELTKSMSLKEIFNTIVDTDKIKADSVRLTFLEGENIRDYVKTIEKNTSIKEEEFYNALSDKEYLKSLIDKYWFLTDDILNSEIYYSLEGYLYPDTYDFNKDDKASDIIEKMLDEEENKLNKYKTSLTKDNVNIHKVITLASIAELEGKTLDDKKNIIGVFYNRLNSNDKLGSDVTTYYAFKKSMADSDLTIDEINTNNPYNTRSDSMMGKLPVGPICNPSIESINASINYTKNDYYYFVSDKNSKIYFSKTSDEHNNIIQKLIKDGLWFTYEE